MTNVTIFELYEHVWNEPLKVLGAKWEVNPRALAQLLDYHNIPRPESGYWTKLSVGKPVTIIPLPSDLPSSSMIELFSLKAAKNEKINSQSRPLPKPSKTIGRYALLKGINGSLKKPTYRFEYLLVQDFSNTDVLRLEVSPEQKARAINILHFLMSEIEKRGWPMMVEKLQYEKRLSNLVVVNGEKIHFRLREKLKQVRRELTPEDFEEKKKWGRISYEKINVPSGELHLTINQNLPLGLNQVFKDNAKVTLEEQLGHFIERLEIAAEHAKSSRTEREEERKKAASKEKLKNRYEAQVTKQANNISDFMIMFEKWQRAQQYRSFINAVQDSEKFAAYSDEKKELWMKWSNDVVNQIDPISQFKMPVLLSDNKYLAAGIFAKAAFQSGISGDNARMPLTLDEIEQGLLELDDN
jgi:hypothetical protein